MPVSLSNRSPHQNPTIYASLLPHIRYMPRPSNSSRFYQMCTTFWKKSCWRFWLVRVNTDTARKELNVFLKTKTPKPLMNTSAFRPPVSSWYIAPTSFFTRCRVSIWARCPTFRIPLAKESLSTRVIYTLAHPNYVAWQCSCIC
jgi:hypothetical protein